MFPKLKKGDDFFMDYQQFLEKVVEELQNTFPEHDIEIRSVRKMNGVKLDGLCIRKKESNIAPTIYMQSYYNLMTHGDSIDSVIQRIIDVYENNQGDEIPENMSSIFTDFDDISRLVYYVVINKEKNEELLDDCPHRDFLDLAIVYKVHIGFDNGTGVGSVLINNQMMKLWSITEEDLFNTASTNTSSLFEPLVQSMGEVLIEMMRIKGTEEQEVLDAIYNMELDKHLLVVTNKSKYTGANVIFLNREVQEQIAEKMNGNYLIIPSSIHETIITDADDVENVKDMVVQVNASEVSEEDFLSNSVYVYDSSKKEIHIVG